MKTFRRDKLRRLVDAGLVTSLSTYHFDDMLGESRSHEPMPVRMMPEDRSTVRDGTVFLFPSDFTSKSGSAYDGGTTKDGLPIVNLLIHSNSSVTMVINSKTNTPTS